MNTTIVANHVNPQTAITSGLAMTRKAIKELRENAERIWDQQCKCVTVKLIHSYDTHSKETSAEARFNVDFLTQGNPIHADSCVVEASELSLLSGYKPEWLNTLIRRAVEDTNICTSRCIKERAGGVMISDEMLCGWFKDMMDSQLESVGIVDGVIVTPLFVDLEVVSVSAIIV